ncbi:cytochrome P450 [Dactylosporangium sp. NPDC005572]|uniref:cytochrome P450 n=1 Tax=Dactylosporangium sp. NPDC005572 TaxID=3156889 RepID=UPI0033AD3A6D
MSNPTATSLRTYARDRIMGWRPTIRHAAPQPGEALPPGPRTLGALQSMRVWGARNTYFPAMQQRYGDTFLLRVTPIGQIVVVCGLEDVRKVALGGPDLFPIGENNSMFEALIGKRTVLSLDGAEHRAERKRIMPAFHGERIAAVVTAMEELTAQEVMRWPIGSDFSLVERMQELALRVIVRVVLGVEDRARAEALAPALRRMVDYSNLELLMLVWPQLARLGPWRKAIAGLDHADDLLCAEIDRRRADPDRHQRADVLSMLLDGDPDDELVRVELVTLLAGGQETSAMAASWMFERLLRHPGALARVRAGLDDPKDEYRTAVINETLRVRPVVYNVGRRATAPVELGGYRVPAGTFVWASLAAIHRDPRIWGEDVEEFRPERWLEPDVPSRAFLPWGGGAHRCLGATFAHIEMEVILRTVLRHVELRADQAADEPMVMRNIFALPKHGARVRVERRLGG